MKASEIIVGLDIGTTKIAVIVGQRDELGKIKILGHGKSDSIGVRRGSVVNIDKATESIKKAVKDAEINSNIKIESVYVGIAGQHIKSIQHHGKIVRDNPDIEISKLDVNNLRDSMMKIQMEPGEKIIHVIPQEFFVDKEQGIKDPVGMLGATLGANFHVVIGQIAAIKNIFRSVERAGLDLQGLILEPLASAVAVLDNTEIEAGVALVDIGGGTTDIAIFHDEVLRHTAVIPLGVNIITEDIKEGCTILKAQAEALKIKYGSALESESPDLIIAIKGLRDKAPKEIASKNLAGIIRARMEEILEQVMVEIINSGYERKLIGGIVLTGGGAMLKNIAQLTEFMTTIDTRIGKPNEHLAGNVSDEMANPMYATGIGLVIKGIENLEEDLEDDEEDENIEAGQENIVDDYPVEENEKIKKRKEKIPKTPKTPKPPKPQKPSLFSNIINIEKIKDFFNDQDL